MRQLPKYQSDAEHEQAHDCTRDEHPWRRSGRRRFYYTALETRRSEGCGLLVFGRWRDHAALGLACTRGSRAGSAFVVAVFGPQFFFQHRIAFAGGCFAQLARDNVVVAVIGFVDRI